MEDHICISIQSRAHPETRCGNRRKEGSLFCGVHAKVAQVTVFQGIQQSGLLSDPIAIQRAMRAGAVAEEAPEPLVITSHGQLCDLLLEGKGDCLSVTVLRNYVKTDPVLSTKTDSTQSRSKMIEDLTEYFRVIAENSTKVPEITRIQAWIRRWLVYRRTKCSNKSDILTMESIFDIPGAYYYCFYDETTKVHYGYDIRVLARVLYDPSNPEHVVKCPYTNRPFTAKEIVRIESHIEKLQKAKIPLKIDRPKMSVQKEVELKCVKIFQIMDDLGNYTNSEWFMSMSFSQILLFYEVAHDVWSQVDMSARRNIVSDGNAFSLPKVYLRNFEPKEGKTDRSYIARNFVLNDMERLVTTSANVEDRKLAAMIIITALVRVSEDAATALPHLVMTFDPYE